MFGCSAKWGVLLVFLVAGFFQKIFGGSDMGKGGLDEGMVFGEFVHTPVSIQFHVKVGDDVVGEGDILFGQLLFHGIIPVGLCCFTYGGVLLETGKG
jgi:hypothetical protein